MREFRPQILINTTIFAAFTFLISLLLCYNLDSSMLNYEDSLTNILTKKYSVQKLHET